MKPHRGVAGARDVFGNLQGDRVQIGSRHPQDENLDREQGAAEAVDQEILGELPPFAVDEGGQVFEAGDLGAFEGEVVAVLNAEP